LRNPEFLEKAEDGIKTSPRNVPIGPNNKLIKKVKFEIGQSDYKTAFVKLTDAENERYSIPEDLVNQASSNPTMDLEMLGFEMTTAPFGFKFGDQIDTSNTYVSMMDSNFIMMDKYL
jgi:hypothetical protein